MDQMYVLHLDSEAGEIIGFVSVNERRPGLLPVFSLHPKSHSSLYVALTLKQQDFSITIKPKYQNQGYGTEAATPLLHYLHYLT
jgi:RimJ/RimL family protein N-acetyltransferase